MSSMTTKVFVILSETEKHSHTLPMSKYINGLPISGRPFYFSIYSFPYKRPTPRMLTNLNFRTYPWAFLK